MSDYPTPANIRIDPLRVIANVDHRIYSGFLEHLGRCIYGGIVPVDGTAKELVTSSGFRSDILHLLRDELKVPLVRWPGGNFVSHYHWQDGIGPSNFRPKRPELAWGAEESNLFGMDEYISWCREANAEPYICLNMGTGTLTEALTWLEYANGTKDTYWANQRRKNTGTAEPHNVKLWGLGNEMWGEWQIGNLSAPEYATKAAQWAHALKLMDPSISLVACGETGQSSWDHVILQKLVKWVDYHSIHTYSSPGQGLPLEQSFERNVFGPTAAEYAIDIVKGLIDLARIEQDVNKPIKIAFDEWNVWDFDKGTTQNGLEQSYDLSDALGVASWLNIFIRKADIVSIACIAQSVNVISPILTSPGGHVLQTIYHPLYLFATYMRSGSALSIEVIKSPLYDGSTFPKWVGALKGPLPYLDSSAVLVGDSSLRLAVVNRHPTQALGATISVADRAIGGQVEMFEVWAPEISATNTFDHPDRVKVVKKVVDWEDHVVFKEHSFTLMVFDISEP